MNHQSGADRRQTMRTRPNFVLFLLLLALFLTAFVPRVVYPVSRPLQWYERSYRFVEAVVQGRWADTVVSEHPGVTPMWLIGASQHGYEALRRFSGDATYSLRASDRAFDTEVFVSVFALAFVIALAVVLAWHLLKLLFGEAAAWAGASFIALDPFHIALSKVVHIDALLSILMILSALLLLVHLRRISGSDGNARLWPRYRTLIASGALAGLAFLTKSPSYFLVPYLGLCLIATRWRAPLLNGYVLPALLWLGAAATVYIVCWPAMWVQPVRTLAMVAGGVVLHAGRAHPQPLYYLGNLVTDDPGLGYYLMSILVKTTALTFPLFVIGLVGLLRKRRRRGRRSGLLLAGYVAFFVLQMGLGAKKAPRYVLPAFPAIDVLAGIGLVTLSRCGFSKRVKYPAVVFVAVALLVQALLVLPYHPYYVTHANLLVGGPGRAQRLLLATPQGEGLDKAADWLNTLPGAATLRVGVQLPAQEALQQRFVGETLDTREPDLDFMVFAAVYVQRGVAQDQWGEQWAMYRYRLPEYVATIRGEPYAWVYAVDDGPQSPAWPMVVCLGDHIRLLGHTVVRDGELVGKQPVHPGDELLVTLHWMAVEMPQGDYSVFVHLVGPDGSLADQQDNAPVNGTHPVSLWVPDERVDDPYTLSVPLSGAGGTYQIVAGMYDWRTGDRLAATAMCETALPEDQVVLASLDARPRHALWWQLLAVVLAGVAVVSGVVGLFRRGSGGDGP